MSVRVEISVSGFRSEQMDILTHGLKDKRELHARIAGEAEAFVKTRGVATAANEHRSARRLGARPTGHLERAYQGIEGQSDGEAATLLVPRASRLRAAFGAYTLTPKSGSKYLTIPVAAESYGRRAREFEDLTFLRVGPRQTAILARTAADGSLETMYVLVKKADIPEDRSLIPFDDLAATARDSAEAYLDEEIEKLLTA